MNPIPSETGAAPSATGNNKELLTLAARVRHEAVDELSDALEAAATVAYLQWHEKWGATPIEAVVELRPPQCYGGAPPNTLEAYARVKLPG